MTDHLGRFGVWMEEGTMVVWTPSNVARMILGRVYVGERLIPRRVVWRRIAGAARAWFDWWAAWPGDRFHVLVRDVYVEVRKPGRTAGYVAGQILATYGDAAFTMAPAEPCRERWWEVRRVV